MGSTKPEKKWGVDTYRKSACRHMQACQYMLDCVGCVRCKPDKNKILQEIFYLGGYILECSLKAVILKNKPNKAGFTKQDLESIGIWNHDLSRIWSIAKDEVGGMPHCKLPDAAKKWHNQLRYDQGMPEGITESDVAPFITDSVKNLYVKLIDMA